MRICHVINSLNRGGAETMLVKLLAESKLHNVNSMVIVILSDGNLEPIVRDMGIRVISLGANKSKFKIISQYLMVRKIIKIFAPNIMYGWLYHGNLAALILRNKIPLIWNIRHSLTDLKNEKYLTRFIIRLGGVLSRYVSAILYNSQAALVQHKNISYKCNLSEVIHNGFETQRFLPNPILRQKTRNNLGIGPKIKVFGMVGRYHPVKDHNTFLQAAGCAIMEDKNLAFILIGKGINKQNTILMDAIKKYYLECHIHLIDEVSSIEQILPAFDCAVLTSLSEGLPNVIGEAMSCGVPCIATDVGDTAILVADTGIIIKPNQPEQLSKNILKYAALSHEERSNKELNARARIVNHYTIEKVTQKYIKLTNTLCKNHNLQ